MRLRTTKHARISICKLHCSQSNIAKLTRHLKGLPHRTAATKSTNPDRGATLWISTVAAPMNGSPSPSNSVIDATTTGPGVTEGNPQDSGIKSPFPVNSAVQRLMINLLCITPTYSAFSINIAHIFSRLKGRLCSAQTCAKCRHFPTYPRGRVVPSPPERKMFCGSNSASQRGLPTYPRELAVLYSLERTFCWNFPQQID